MRRTSVSNAPAVQVSVPPVTELSTTFPGTRICGSNLPIRSVMEAVGNGGVATDWYDCAAYIRSLRL